MQQEIVMDQKIVELVNSIMEQKFEVPRENLVGTASLKEDLKLDSLDFVDMVVLLEEKVGGPMPDFDFMAIKTLNDIYSLVEKITLAKNQN